MQTSFMGPGPGPGPWGCPGSTGGLGVPHRLEKCTEIHLLYHLGDIQQNTKLYMFIVDPLLEISPARRLSEASWINCMLCISVYILSTMGDISNGIILIQSSCENSQVELSERIAAQTRERLPAAIVSSCESSVLEQLRP